MHSDRYYFYQHNRLAVVAENKCATRLLYANGQPVCQISGLNAQTHLLGSDRTGSVLAAITSSKSIRISYTPYGSVPEAASPILPGYNGEIFDRSRAYLLGSGERAYYPDLMRFRSPDRASIFLPGNQNSYVYVAGDPINYFDPTGNIKTLVQLRDVRMTPRPLRLGMLRDRQRDLRIYNEYLISSRSELTARTTDIERFKVERTQLRKFKAEFKRAATEDHSFRLEPEKFLSNSDHIKTFQQISTNHGQTSGEYKSTIYKLLSENYMAIEVKKRLIQWTKENIEEYEQRIDQLQQAISRLRG